MPEVVEVCWTALYLNHEFKNKTLTNINAIGGRYLKNNISGISNFKNSTIIEINSKGKLLWFKTEYYYILSTFGLTGMWGYSKSKHTAIELLIDDKKIYYTDQLHYGTIKIVNEEEFRKKINSLKPDFLKESFTDDEFYDRVKWFISKYNVNIEIIKILMESSGKSLGSGLGNYLAPSILYESKISPYKTIKKISKDEALMKDLSYNIKYVTKLCFLTADIGYFEDLDKHMYKFISKTRREIINNVNHPLNFHKDVSIGNDVFSFKVYRQIKDPLGNIVKKDNIIPGRTTYWVPSIQK